MNKLLLGNCLDKLKELEDNSIDSIVTDPPYGLAFMNKKWDYDVPSVEIWRECLRVLKPGGHLLSFGGTRTYHRMVVNIEDAGFEIRDQIQWIYGSGFPKSHNIGKAVDKIGGNEREVVGEKEQSGAKFKNWSDDPEQTRWHNQGFNKLDGKLFDITKGNSPYEGWGTALKPANEPICLARKPFKGSVANNVLEWGTGGINIDGCRIGYEDTPNPATNPKYRYTNNYKMPEGGQESNGAVNFTSSKNPTNLEGRFPANIILDEEAAKILDEQSGVSKTSANNNYKWDKTECESNTFRSRGTYIPRNDSGGASRFFYVAKASKKDRDEGLEGIILQLSNLSLHIDYNTKKVVLWESQDQKVQHQEVMELLIKKGIEESQLKEVMVNTILKWNTELYGKNIMDQYQLVGTFITLMVINLITELKILNVSIEQNTNENILKCLSGMDFGGNYVLNAMNGNHNMIFIQQKKDGLKDNVNLVELEEVLKIKVKERKNIHATVKPTKLMQYLCRLITPTGGTILDPFMGSGSTGKAAIKEGFYFVGIEMDPDYLEIAKERIEYEYKRRSN